jgi:hypothetical protein|tara:strand:- start:277 stop:450 length:174 start_codon:yes stop_codon:yes gene_type:complete
MKVKELIKELEKAPQNIDVEMWADELLSIDTVYIPTKDDKKDSIYVIQLSNNKHDQR